MFKRLRVIKAVGLAWMSLGLLPPLDAASAAISCDAFECAIVGTLDVGNGTVILNAASLVDSYDSSLGAYGGANVSAHGNVLSAGGVINNGGEVHGSVTRNTPTGYTVIPPPQGLAPMNGGAPTLVEPDQVLTLAAGDYLYSDLIVKARATLRLTGPVRIWINGSLIIEGNVAGDGQPAHLQFLVTGGGTVNLNSPSSTYAVIYAPAAPVTVAQVVFGTVIGRNVTLDSQAAVHLDRAEFAFCSGPTPSVTRTRTRTRTRTSTRTRTRTRTASPSATHTPSPTRTPSPTLTPTQTLSPSLSPTPTPTITPTPSVPSLTQTPFDCPPDPYGSQPLPVTSAAPWDACNTQSKFFALVTALDGSIAVQGGSDAYFTGVGFQSLQVYPSGGPALRAASTSCCQGSVPGTGHAWAVGDALTLLYNTNVVSDPANWQQVPPAGLSGADPTARLSAVDSGSAAGACDQAWAVGGGSGRGLILSHAAGSALGDWTTVSTGLVPDLAPLRAVKRLPAAALAAAGCPPGERVLLGGEAAGAYGPLFTYDSVTGIYTGQNLPAGLPADLTITALAVLASGDAYAAGSSASTGGILLHGSLGAGCQFSWDLLASSPQGYGLNAVNAVSVGTLTAVGEGGVTIIVSNGSVQVMHLGGSLSLSTVLLDPNGSQVAYCGCNVSQNFFVICPGTTPTPTPTFADSFTATASFTASDSPTGSPTPTLSASESASFTASNTPGEGSPTPTLTPTPTRSAEASASATASASPVVGSPTPTPTYTGTPSPGTGPSAVASATPTGLPGGCCIEIGCPTCPPPGILDGGGPLPTPPLIHNDWPNDVGSQGNPGGAGYLDMICIECETQPVYWVAGTQGYLASLHNGVWNHYTLNGMQTDTAQAFTTLAAGPAGTGQIIASGDQGEVYLGVPVDEDCTDYVFTSQALLPGVSVQDLAQDGGYAYAVGSLAGAGVLLRSPFGGPPPSLDTWTDLSASKLPGTQPPLNAITATAPQDLWILGDQGTILHAPDISSAGPAGIFTQVPGLDPATTSVRVVDLGAPVQVVTVPLSTIHFQGLIQVGDWRLAYGSRGVVLLGNAVTGEWVELPSFAMTAQTVNAASATTITRPGGSVVTRVTLVGNGGSILYWDSDQPGSITPRLLEGFAGSDLSAICMNVICVYLPGTLVFPFPDTATPTATPSFTAGPNWTETESASPTPTASPTVCVSLASGDAEGRSLGEHLVAEATPSPLAPWGEVCGDGRWVSNDPTGHGKSGTSPNGLWSVSRSLTLPAGSYTAILLVKADDMVEPVFNGTTLMVCGQAPAGGGSCTNEVPGELISPCFSRPACMSYDVSSLLVPGLNSLVLNITDVICGYTGVNYELRICTRPEDSTPTVTPTATPSATREAADSETVTPTVTPSATREVADTETPTPTASPSATGEVTDTETATPSPSVTEEVLDAETATPSATPSATEEVVVTETATPALTPSSTPSGTPTPTPTPTGDCRVLLASGDSGLSAGTEVEVSYQALLDTWGGVCGSGKWVGKSAGGASESLSDGFLSVTRTVSVPAGNWQVTLWVKADDRITVGVNGINQPSWACGAGTGRCAGGSTGGTASPPCFVIYQATACTPIDLSSAMPGGGTYQLNLTVEDIQCGFTGMNYELVICSLEPTGTPTATPTDTEVVEPTWTVTETASPTPTGTPSVTRCPVVAGPGWSMTGLDPSQASLSTATGPAAGVIRWSAPGGQVRSPIIDLDGRVISGGDSVYAYNAFGDLLWRTSVSPVSSKTFEAVLALAGRLYVKYSGGFRILDPASGVLLGAFGEGLDYTAAGPLGAGGGILNVGYASGQVQMLDTAGALIWSASTAGGNTSYAMDSTGRAYVLDQSGLNVYGGDGSLAWTSSGSSYDGGLVLDGEDNAYVLWNDPADNYLLWARKLAPDGTELWRVSLPGYGVSPYQPALSADGGLVLLAFRAVPISTNALKLSMADGSLVWTRQVLANQDVGSTTTAPRRRLVVDAQGKVFLPLRSEVTALDAGGGRLWSLPIGGASGLALSPDGTLYVSADLLYAIGGDPCGPPPPTATPRATRTATPSPSGTEIQTATVTPSATPTATISPTRCPYLAGPAWPMSGGSASQTGRSDATGPAGPAVRWTGVGGPSAPIVDPAGRVIAMGSAEFRAYNAFGDMQWQSANFPLGSRNFNAPLAWDNTVLIRSSLGLSQLDPGDGHTISTLFGNYPLTPTGPLGAGNRVYLCGFLGDLEVRRSGDLGLEWSASGNMGLDVAVDAAGRVYWLDSSQLRVFQPDGSLAWSYPAPSNRGSLSLDGDGTAYLVYGNYGTARACALAPDGSVEWDVSLGADLQVADWHAALSSDGGLVFMVWTAQAPYTRAVKLNLTDGSRAWMQPVSPGYEPYPNLPPLRPLVADAAGRVYLPLNAEGVLALDAAGTVLWNLPLGGPVAGLALSSDGTLYASDYRTLYAIGGDPCAPPPPTATPRATRTATPAPSATATPSGTTSRTATPTASPSPSATRTPTPTPGLQVPVLLAGLVASTGNVIVGGLVDSYLSCAGPYSAATARANGHVRAGGSITVNGGGSILGVRTPNSPSSPASYPVPAGLASSGDLMVNAVQTRPGGDYLFNNITLNSGGLSFSGPARVWFTGSLNLNAPLTAAGGLPGNLWVFGAPGSSLNVNPGGVVTAVLYAPSLDFTLNGTVYGAVVSRSFNLNGGGRLHYDEMLSGVGCGASSPASSELSAARMQPKQSPLPVLDRPLLVVPNPARDRAKVLIHLERGAAALLRLRSLDGSLARVVDLGELDAGEAAVELDLRPLASGIYFVVLEADGKAQAAFKLAVVH